jgi:stress response protein YsnF
MKTIIAAFCDRMEAQQALQYLQSRGVRDVQLLSYQDSNPIERLGTFNVPDDRAQLYAEVMRRGAPLLVAHTEDDARALASELDRYGSLDIKAAEKRWRDEGWDGHDATAMPYDAQACAQERELLRQESGIEARGPEGSELDVVEEKVNVGKREVSRGGVRIRTFVAERPIHEEVQLRDERIDVRRERVDEPIGPGAADSTFTEDEFVVTARGEEAVVGKEARVVERVHLGKAVDTRTETIDETERRRDVEVEQLDDDRLHKDSSTRRH